MKAYVIGSVQMRDDSWVKEYAAKTEAIVTRHGGRYLVRGATMEKLEGAGPLPHVMVVIEFPSYEAARACWDSPEYQAVKALRDGHAVADIIVIEGYDGPQP